MMPIGKLAAAVVGLAVVWLSVVGCAGSGSGGPSETTPDRVGELEDTLRTKPPFEAARDQYASAMQQMADQIAALVPGTTWQVKEDGSAVCAGELASTHGAAVYHYIVFDHPIPDELWPRALDIVKTGAAGFGATDVQTLVDKPGDKDVAIVGSDGVKFEFGTAAQTVFSGTSDCRLRASDTP
ncbi:hypothetical protein DVS77_21720 [Mycolicibacterium moriokaense]|nr:hypothetical protein DVS77_21720 [Mycolicibacterium moriokaense]